MKHFKSGNAYLALNEELATVEEYSSSDSNFLLERYHKKLNAEVEWFEKMIKHPLFIGTFYENLIRATICEFAPKNQTVATGFVYDAEKNEHGKQIDILVYDDTDQDVLYRSNEFVVVFPGSVVSVSEIKKTITSSSIKEVIKSTLFNSLGSKDKSIYGIQNLKIFGFYLKGSINSILNSIVNEIDKILELDEFMHNSIVLPQIYFLNEPYLIETHIDYESEIEFKIRADLYKCNDQSSLAFYLNSITYENKDKRTIYENNYKGNKVRDLAEKTVYTKKNVSLIKQYAFKEIIKHYRLTSQEIKNYIGNDVKPTRIFIPIHKTLDDYTSIDHLISAKGTKAAIVSLTNQGGQIISANEITNLL